MFTIILCWFLMSFVFLSLGHILVHAYNRFGKCREKYNICDVLILGMCFTCGFLAFFSIWFPSDQYILLFLVFACVLFWIANKRKLKEYIFMLKSYVRNMSVYELVLIVVSFTALLLCCSWTMIGHDASMYHYQLIRWNEEYPLVPGLGNIEERFGFNSNYFLVSSIFTLRFLFDEALYCLQGLLAFFVMAWIVISVFRSHYSIKTILLLFIYLVFLHINNYDFRTTSSDIVPNLLVFYLFARLIINPELLRTNYLFYLFVPIVLATFKLSAGLFSLIALYPLILMFREKQHKRFIFICLSLLFVFVPWFIRNVVISGYLIYPLYQLDLFSFDWKIPLDIAQKEYVYVHEYGKIVFDRIFDDLFQSKIKFKDFIYLPVFFVLLASPIIIAISFFIKKNKLNGIVYYIYGILLVNLLFWYISAPDPRFASGALLVGAFLVLSVFIPANKDFISNKKIASLLIGILVFYPLLNSVKWVRTYSTDCKSLAETIYKPRFASDTNGEIENYPIFTPYRLNPAVTIFVTSDEKGRCYDRIPCVKELNYGEDNYQDYKCLEARGYNVSDGFRYRSK